MAKGITAVDKYEFKLGDELKTVAETELRETPSAREFGLNALREWINANPRIIAVRLGKVHNIYIFRIRFEFYRF